MQKRSRQTAKQSGSKPRRATKPRGESTLGKLARVVDAAMKDADAARKSAFDPQFKRELGKDRRTTLSRFRTVQHALEDRERIAKAKSPKPKT
ncbi:MAG: hypothetical protein E6I87_14340 [Chloroflexi bacterium]|nr:MAG: hypothetical protein E6I87_14340 [Chloroflexota bacterium]